ncbi:MAG: cytochrome c [Sediminibacterium sp.]|nr:cytochrome c [Sediminibacterium sp.]
MDFPMFHLDWLNDRFLIALIAILHVCINHGLAVGFIPFITRLEQQGVMYSDNNKITDPEWDTMVYRMMKVGFLITTSLGAMTGVGIWISVSVVSPSSIASLIRVFYWAWFTEWLVFVTEVILILIYFLTWKNSNKSLKAKLRHIKFGWFLSFFSWVTMAIIVAILGFMMDPGNWNTDHSLINGFVNPIYLPQLIFRTPTAMLVAGVFGYVLSILFTGKDTAIRIRAVKQSSRWILFWTPLSLGGAVFYYRAIPQAMTDNMSTAVGTLQFAEYYSILKYVIVAAISTIYIVAALGIFKPGKVRLFMVLLPCIMAFVFLAIFERVREFIRKPYVIGGYMYSNLLRVEDYPLYKRDGILKYAVYTSTAEVTESNKIEAGRNVFILTCSRCHTTQGINSIVFAFERMYGIGKPFDEVSVAAFIKGMHNGRTFMPEFPGNKKELEALASYIKNLQQTGDVIEGAQNEGVVVNPNQSVTAVMPLIESKQSVLADSLMNISLFSNK